LSLRRSSNSKWKEKSFVPQGGRGGGGGFISNMSANKEGALLISSKIGLGCQGKGGGTKHAIFDRKEVGKGNCIGSAANNGEPPIWGGKKRKTTIFYQKKKGE